MSVRRRGTAALVALAAALSLAACGSDGGSDEKSSPGAGADKKAVAQGGEDFAEAAAKTAGYGTDAKPGEFPVPSPTPWARPSSTRGRSVSSCSTSASSTTSSRSVSNRSATRPPRATRAYPST